MVRRRLHENWFPGQTALPDIMLSVDVSALSCATCGAVDMVSTMAAAVPAVEREVTCQRMDQPFLGAFLLWSAILRSKS